MEGPAYLGHSSPALIPGPDVWPKRRFPREQCPASNYRTKLTARKPRLMLLLFGAGGAAFLSSAFGAAGAASPPLLGQQQAGWQQAGSQHLLRRLQKQPRPLQRSRRWQKQPPLHSLQDDEQSSPLQQP